MSVAAEQRSDLLIRSVSAFGMIVAATVLFITGGTVFNVAVAMIGAMVLWEWWTLALKLNATTPVTAIVVVAGALYIGLASVFVIGINVQDIIDQSQMAPGSSVTLTGRTEILLPIVAAVIATDIAAYIAGRVIGGPRLAPSISPGKTLAGAVGGLAAGGAAYAYTFWHFENDWAPEYFSVFIVQGLLISLVSQSGDLAESWFKRRAGVKDSGVLIPGHGGVFDRLDGMIAVFFVCALIWLAR